MPTLNELVEQEQSANPELKLNSAEKENDVSLITSIGAGIASGLIKIPEGAASLYANIYDLTNDTNTAADVENWFDENIYKKLGNLDEKAQATTAGKIAQALINVGVPGGVAFRYGTKAANYAIKNAKAGKYFRLNNPTLRKGMDKTLELNKKGKAAKFITGAAVGGGAEGVFIADAEEFGTFGDLLGTGPTELERGSDYDPARELLNRIKFGTEGALFTGVIAGTGKTIKLLAKRGNDLKYSESAGLRSLSRVASKFTAAGAKGKEFFMTRRAKIGERAADLNEAQQRARTVSIDIDRIYSNIRHTLPKTTKIEKDELYKDFDDIMFSGKPSVSDTGKVSMGKMDTELGKNFVKNLLRKGAKRENVDNILANIGMMRKKWEEMADVMGSKLSPQQIPGFREIIKKQFKDWIGSTYGIFENKSSIPFLNYKPPAEAYNKVKNILLRNNRRQIWRAKEKNLPVPKRMTELQAEWYVDQMLTGIRRPKTFLRGQRDLLGDIYQRDVVPYYRVPTSFVKNSIADEFMEKEFFIRKLERSVNKGRWAKEEFVPKGKKGKLKKEKVPTRIGSGSKAFRELFGEVKDIRQTMLHGTERMSMVARKNQFLENLWETSEKAAAAGGRKMFYDSQDEALQALGPNAKVGKIRMQSAFKEEPLTNPLQNKWADQDIADALMTTETRLINDKTISFLYDSLFLFPKSTSQLAKTVLSPVTHARNFFSAATFQTANGIWLTNPKALGKAWQEAMGALQPQIIRQNPEKANQFYRKLLRLGVVNSNVRLGDLTRLMSDINFGKNISQERMMRIMYKYSGMKRLKNVAQDAYVAEDDFWKISNYILERARYKRAYDKAFKNGKIQKKITDDMLDEKAADIVRNTVPNYEYVPEFIRALRRLPVGNFVSFPAEILRTSTNIVAKSLDEIADPITRSIGMRRLAGLSATTAILPPGVVEAVKMIYDVTEDELMALKKFLPRWSKNSTILPVKTPDGQWKYIDFSHGFAYDTITRPVQTVLNEVGKGVTNKKPLMEGFMKGMAQATSELGEPFIRDSIWTEALFDIIQRGGKTRDGKTLYTDATPWGERQVAMMKHLVEAQAPFSYKQFERLFGAAKGEYSDTGRKYDLSDEVMGFTGYRPVPIDPARSLDFMVTDYQRGTREARREFTAKVLRGGEVDPQFIIDRFLVANEAKWKNMKDMSQNLTAARILGTSDDNMKSSLGRLSRSDKRALEDMEFVPFNISKGVAEAFEKNAERMGVANPYELVRDMLRDLYKEMDGLPLWEREFPQWLKNMFNLKDMFSEQTGAPQTLNAPNVSQNVARLPLTYGQINPTTGLTNNQTALLSPSDQAIARNINRRA